MLFTELVNKLDISFHHFSMWISCSLAHSSGMKSLEAFAFLTQEKHS